jgi:hypothetical protein
MISTRAVTQATIVGTVLQLAMVLVGHSNTAVAALFAPVGMAISAIAGIMYARAAEQRTTGSLALGGFVSGGLCALIGIAVSFYLGDVTASILALGTLSSAVTGAIGGMLGKVMFGASRATA